MHACVGSVFVPMFLIFVIFVLSGNGKHILMGAAQLVIVGVLLLPAKAQGAIMQRYAAAIALEVFWLGLICLRVILRRSVSLSLLSGQRRVARLDIDQAFSSRFEDLHHYHLVRESDDHSLTLTNFGKIVAVIVSFLRVFFRSKP